MSRFQIGTPEFELQSSNFRVRTTELDISEFEPQSSYSRDRVPELEFPSSNSRVRTRKFQSPPKFPTLQRATIRKNLQELVSFAVLLPIKVNIRCWCAPGTVAIWERSVAASEIVPFTVVLQSFTRMARPVADHCLAVSTKVASFVVMLLSLIHI